MEYPTNLDQVVSLVHQLYQPGEPQKLQAIQNVLQQVQRSPEGWQLADSFLESSEQNIQFFGALTFTVKLNSDWQTIPESEIPILRNRLLNWVVRLLANGATQLVLKKICSTLVVFFLRYPETFQRPIRHLLCCLSAGEVRSLEDFEDKGTAEQLVVSLGPVQKLAGLWFETMIVEEVGKIEARNAVSQRYHIAVHADAAEAIALLADAVTMRSGHADPKVVEIGLKTFQSWVFYSIRASLEASVEYPELKALTPTVINWLAVEEQFDVACDVIIEILSHSYSFLTPNDSMSLSEILVSQWGADRYNEAISGDGDTDAEQFARLLVTYSEATVHNLALCLDTPRGRAVMDMMHGFLTVPGYANVEDEISGSTFEFWGSLVDFVIDTTNDGEWVEWVKRDIARAIQEFWRKIRMPPTPVSTSWRKDQKDGFIAYRRDVADFIEASYEILHSQLFQQFVDQVVNVLAGRSHHEVPWEDVEATLYCLNALADSLGEEPTEDSSLEMLFGSPLFSFLSQVGDTIPLKARTTSVTMIGSYASFFEKHPTYLPAALNFLFTCLSTPALTPSASKSIASLCSSCRTSLTSEVSAFLQQYKIFVTSPGADDTAKERVLCAISYVVQALPSDEARLEPTAALLEYVAADARQSIDLLYHDAQEAARDLATNSLRCLVAIGKGLQVPEDVPIDLGDNTSANNFWNVGPGRDLQAQLLQIIQSICSTFQHVGEIIDTACAIFKTGFTETVPCLFGIDADVVTDFLLQYSWRTETILATASTFVGSHSVDKRIDIRPRVVKLMQLVDTLTEQLGNPQKDPEIAQSSVEFLHKVVRCYPEIFVQYQPANNLERLVLFTLNSLSVREPLVKKAATGFWSSLLTLFDLELGVQQATDGIVLACGPRLAEKLVSAIAGGCQRSEVEVFADPLRKLVTRHPRVKSWLQAAVEDNTTLGVHVTPQDKMMFVEKVISLRGKRATNQVAKDFWLKCRGTDFSYVS